MNKNLTKIVKLSDAEHVLKRPEMYVGSVRNATNVEYIYNDILEIKEISYPPAFAKIINEIIDNSIDVILKTGIGDRIKIDFKDNEIIIEDNSSGFPLQDNNEEEPVLLAFSNARAGSNFNDDSNVGQIGMNGVGGFVTNVFSERFEVESQSKLNNKQCVNVKVLWVNNSSKHKLNKTIKDTDKTFTRVKFTPDYSLFTDKFNLEDVMNVLKARIIILNELFKDIKFYFNGERLNKKINSLVNANKVIEHKSKDYSIILSCDNPNNNIDLTVLNGLMVKDNGTIINYIYNNLTDKIKSKLKTITSKDVKNCIRIFFIGSNFKNAKFASQTKEKQVNSTKEVEDYLGNIDSFINKIARDKDIIEFLSLTLNNREKIEVASELKKSQKKLKYEKYFPGKHADTLLIVEGDSALGGLMPVLGRQSYSYFAIRGKPLNSWDLSIKRVFENEELKNLITVIQNNNYKRIVFATDQDLDGFHIRGLLLACIYKHLSNYKNNVYYLRTPICGVINNKNSLQRWVYNITDKLEVNRGESVLYFKGLGSFDRDELKFVIKTDGINNMLVRMEDDESTYLSDWLGNDSDKRKEYILSNDFNLSSL